MCLCSPLPSFHVCISWVLLECLFSKSAKRSKRNKGLKKIKNWPTERTIWTIVLIGHMKQNSVFSIPILSAQLKAIAYTFCSAGPKFFFVNRRKLRVFFSCCIIICEKIYSNKQFFCGWLLLPVKSKKFVCDSDSTLCNFINTMDV